MRAGPLSNAKVIQTLNHFFVPVYVSMEDYEDAGAAAKEEKAEYRRIYLEAAQAGLSVGTVHAYVLTPAGHPMDSLHVAKAAEGNNLQHMLTAAVEKLKTVPGEALVKPTTQAACPVKPSDGSLTIHVVAQAEGTNPADGSWHAFPGEDWVVLKQSEAARLLPPGARPSKLGDSWDVDRDVAGRILTYFYPQTENNDISTNRIDRQELKASIVSIAGDRATARLQGSLRMKHTFYPHREDDNFVNATFVGFLVFDPTTHKIRSLRLATENATYGKTKFDAVASDDL
jgi:hypothetical protein